MRAKLRHCLPLIAALGLAACVPGGATAPSGQAATSGDSGVNPGAEMADGISAMLIFTRVCLDTQPHFKKAPAVLADLPFRQRPETGTYYHQNLDLSVKLVGGRCSMVFTSADDPTQLGILMSAASGNGQMSIDPNTGAASTVTKNGARLEFEPIGRSKGRNWYRAVLIPH